ncbi:hypothetical protein GR168_18310 [Gordonia sp. JH63]|nr:hypothetical protein GR168_18310 [Gordonia sp. JH63]
MCNETADCPRIFPEPSRVAPHRQTKAGRDPEDRRLRHLCNRIGNLINANLPYTYGQ